MATIRIVLGIICLIALSCSTEPGSGVLKGCREKGYGGKNKAQVAKPKHPGLLLYTNHFILTTQARNTLLTTQARNPQHITRNTLLTIARSQIGTREATGSNDGLQVAAYLKATNLPEGNPWCAAFITWVFRHAGFDRPRTAWSPALFSLARQTTTPKPADVLGIYSLKLKRIAHAGLVEYRQNNWIISIEGNTNVSGGREGDGVYRKRRHIKTIARFADWLR